MISTVELKSSTVKELEKIARDLGIAGYTSMKKDELVKVLIRKVAAVKAAKTRATKSSSTRSAKNSRSGSSRKVTTAKRNGTGSKAKRKSAPRSTVALKRIRKSRELREQQKDLSLAPVMATAKSVESGRKKDRVVLLVRDSYWLHACWQVTRRSVERVRAAMNENWHSARPIIRLYELEYGTTTNVTSNIVRDIEIHSGVTNWYIDVFDPPKSYRIELGYLADNGQFHSIGRSNVVSTPKPGTSDAIDNNWSDIAEDYERIYAMSGGGKASTDSRELKELFEERLRRPMNATLPAVNIHRVTDLEEVLRFDVDAELIIYGKTDGDASLILNGKPIKLRPDGTFTVRQHMPDRRQVIPLVATTKDGIHERTVVLAVERNTKVMDPVNKEMV